MKQDEFIDSFCEALAGKVPDDIIQDNANYYRNYIRSEIARGKSEEEVLAQLGDARLLAKTIEESAKFARGDREYEQESTAYQTQEDAAGHEGYHHIINLPAWLLSIIGIALTMVVIVVAFSLISFFAPVIITVIVVMMIAGLVRAWRSRY